MLGHRAPEMTLVYAHLSDRAVVEESQRVLGPGAWPADRRRAPPGTLPTESVEWLKANFFKTELELGQCFRLPQEGPCECDLYLNCAKFVTTQEYAPGLRARWHREQELAADATERGWDASGSGMPAPRNASSNCWPNWASRSRLCRTTKSLDFDDLCRVVISTGRRSPRRGRELESQGMMLWLNSISNSVITASSPDTRSVAVHESRVTSE